MAKSTKPMVRIHDLTTDEVVDRVMTDEEFAEYQAEQVEQEAKKAEAEAHATARQAILDRLGLTAEEAALIIG
jgi:hypothetical protein